MNVKPDETLVDKRGVQRPRGIHLQSHLSVSDSQDKRQISKERSLPSGSSLRIFLPNLFIYFKKSVIHINDIQTHRRRRWVEQMMVRGYE